MFSAVFYDDPAAAIPWLVRAFGFEVRLKVEGEGGRILHAELTYGEGLITLGNSGTRGHFASPRALGAKNTQNVGVYVDDVDAHCAGARQAGARIVTEPTTTDYGEAYWADRAYQVEDLEGHHWWFIQRVRDPGERR